MPEPAQNTPTESIIRTVGLAIGKQRRQIDDQLKALKDQNEIFVNRLQRTADLGLDALLDECAEDAETYCQAQFGDPLQAAYGEYHFASALSADILRSDGTPLVRGKGTKGEHLKILLLRAVERICGRPVPRGFHDSECANAGFLRSKAGRLHSYAAGLSGDPLGDVRALYLFHMIEDAKALGANHAALRPVEVKLAKVRDALSISADQWAATIDKYGYTPHRQALMAHKLRNDKPLPPAYQNNAIAQAAQSCAASFEEGQPYQLRVLRENADV